MRRCVPIVVVGLACAAFGHSLDPAGEEPLPTDDRAVVVEPFSEVVLPGRESLPNLVTSGALVFEPVVEVQPPSVVTWEAAAEQPAERRAVRVVALQHADAAALAVIVRTIWPHDVLVAADPRTNSLIVRCSADDYGKSCKPSSRLTVRCRRPPGRIRRRPNPEVWTSEKSGTGEVPSRVRQRTKPTARDPAPRGHFPLGQRRG